MQRVKTIVLDHIRGHNSRHLLINVFDMARDDTQGRTAQHETPHAISMGKRDTLVPCVSQSTVANISEDSTETELIETSYLNAVTNNHQVTTS